MPYINQSNMKNIDLSQQQNQQGIDPELQRQLQNRNMPSRQELIDMQRGEQNDPQAMIRQQQGVQNMSVPDMIRLQQKGAQNRPGMARGGMVDEDPKLFDTLMHGTSEQSQPVSYTPPSPLMINQDGNQYAFQPGQNGSMTVMGNQPRIPLFQERNRNAKVINMADGGIVADGSQRDAWGNVIGGLSPGQPQVPSQPPPQEPDLPPVAPSAPPQKLTSPISAPVPQKPSAPLPGMPPSVTPEQLAGYLNTQKNSVDQYGPQAQMDLQNQLNARHNSFGYKLADAGKGFADALMMGVARAGNPGFQNQFEGQENQYAADQMNTLRGAQEGNLKGTEAKMSLDKMNPNSVLSKTAQDSYGPLFQKLGYNPKAISSMSAANIDSALNLMTQYGGKEIEAMIKQYELKVEQMRTETAMKNVESESQNREAGRKLEEKKMRLEHPLASLFGGGGESAPTAENFNHDAIPKGSTYTAPDGTTRIKR